MKLFQKLVKHYYLPKLSRLEKEIGFKLVFNYIPESYIPAMMSCEMTDTWKRFGLNVEKGLNHFTMGKVVDGVSARFDRNSSAYQSWLGGYTVKLASDSEWDFKDHFKLAIADQNSWLRRYGDPNPKTSVEGWKLVELDTIQLGNHIGTIYEYGCTTHSDVGVNSKTFSLLYGIYGMAALYNLANPVLSLNPNNFIPKKSGYVYEPIDLKGYVAIFDIKPRVKLVLYGNGVIPSSSYRNDTFVELKDDLRKALESCDLILI